MSISILMLGLWLLHCAVGGGMLMLLARFVMMRARQPALTQRVGEWGLAAALLVAVLALFPAWLILPWKVSGVSSPPDAGAPLQTSSALVLALERLPAEPEADVLVPLLPEETAPAVERGDAAWNEPAKESDANSQPWLRLQQLAPAILAILVLYGAGVVFFLGRLALAVCSLRRLVRSTIPAPEELRRDLQELVAGARLPRLLLSPNLRIPLSFGLLRPTIVLPVDLCAEQNLNRLRWVLAHELTHLQRRDAWSGLLCGLAQAVYFFLPWCWSMCRHIRLCQEYVADAAAVDADQEADYAEFLLTLTKARALPVVATGVSGNTSDLFRRVTMLVEKPIQVERTCSRRWLFLAAASLFTLAVVVSGVGLADGGRRTIIIIEEGGEAQKKETHKTETHSGRLMLTPKIVTFDGKKIIILQGNPHKAKEAGKKVKVRVFGLGGNQAFGKFRTDGKKEGKVLIFGVGGPGHKKEEKKFMLWLGKSGMGKDHPKFFKLKSKDGKIFLNLMEKGKDMPKAQGFFWRFDDKQNSGKAKSTRFPFPLMRIEGQIELPNKLNKSEVEEALKKLETILDKKEVERLRGQIKKTIEKARTLKKGQLWIDPHTQNAYWIESSFILPKNAQFKIAGVLPGANQGMRLGVQLAEPSQILADQLNLPEGKGLVLSSVYKGTPAAKAGLRDNDVLLKLAGKWVPRNPDALIKMVSNLRSSAEFDAVIVRKGRQQTIRGIRLARSKSAGVMPANLPQGSVQMRVLLKNENFTGEYQKGKLTVHVAGKVRGGRAAVENILIREGGNAHSYDSADRVPARHRATVDRILNAVRDALQPKGEK